MPRRRKSGGLLGGLWELPGGNLSAGEEPSKAVLRLLRENLALEVGEIAPAGRVRHTFTHRQLTLHVFRAAARAGRTRRTGYAQHRWIAPHSFRALAHATVTRKVLAELGENGAEDE